MTNYKSSNKMTNELSTTQNPRFIVDPNGIWASVMLAFLTTAGIFYINIMPAVVSGLKEGLGFTNQQAGFVSSANLYGASLGALAAVFLIKHIDWKRWSYVLMGLIIAIDLICIVISNPWIMIATRAVHGLVGGLLVGIGFGIISRTASPDRTFGYLLFIQWGLGGLGLMYLPGLVPEFGVSALFLSLVAFTLTSLVMLVFLPDYPVPQRHTENAGQDASTGNNNRVNKLPLVLTLLAILVFQAANMGLFAYMIALGKAEGLSIDFMSPSLAAASWVALGGAFLVIVIGTRYGRTLPLAISIVLTALFSWLLHFSENPDVYLYGNIAIGICWAFVLPYLFGICSELDKGGQYAALGGFASKMGLASGPMIAALLLSDDHYSIVINAAVVGLLLCVLVVFQPARLLDR